jgi:hypothetical protein
LASHSNYQHPPAHSIEQRSHGALLTAVDAQIVNGRATTMETCSVPALDRASIEAFVGASTRAPSPGCVLVKHEFKGAASRVAPDKTAFTLRRDHVLIEIIAAITDERKSRRRGQASAMGTAWPGRQYHRAPGRISQSTGTIRDLARNRELWRQQGKIAARKRKLMIAITCSRRRSRCGYQVRSEALIASLTIRLTPLPVFVWAVRIEVLDFEVLTISSDRSIRTENSAMPDILLPADFGLKNKSGRSETIRCGSSCHRSFVLVVPYNLSAGYIEDTTRYRSASVKATATRWRTAGAGRVTGCLWARGRYCPY